MIFQAHSDAELTDSQLDELANQLVNKRHELADMLDKLDLQIAAKDDCSLSDAAEAASLQENRVRASGIADQHRQTIAEINLALSRLENGRYGVNETSGEPIAYERLLLIPWARTGSDE